jgi:hypothetical protein
MSAHYEKHAEQLADTFLGLLDESVRAGISEGHRAELAMLVEAAISTAVLEQLENAANEVAALSDRLRRRAEHYDKAPA